MRTRILQFVLLLGLGFLAIPSALFAQSAASLSGFGGVLAQPYRSGDVITIYGSNMTGGICDQVLMFTGGVVGDTVYYTDGISNINTPKTFMRVLGATDSLYFRVDTSITCSQNTFVRLRKRTPCPGPTTNTFTSNSLFFEVGKRASIMYPVTDSVFCVGAANAIPLELQDNVFYSFISSSLPGNPLNSTTNGTIWVHSGNVGTHYISAYTAAPNPTNYIFCNDTHDVRIVIRPMASTSYSYNGGLPLCPTLTTAQALTPADTFFEPGGTFASIPPGITFNASGGIIPSTSTPRSYQVVYTAPDTACLFPSATNVVIDTINTSVFQYPSGICQGDISTLPNITTLMPGTFSFVPVGFPTGTISINGVSGEVSVPATTLGTFQIRFTPTDACRTVTTDNVLIVKTPESFFSFGADSVLCRTGDSALVPLVPVSAGGTFSSWGGILLSGNNIDLQNTPNNGGPFYVTYHLDTTHTSNGTFCSDSTQIPVMIFGPTPVTIEYPSINDGFCDGNQLLSPVFSQGPTGGVFHLNTITGSGTYVINQNTGVIDLGTNNVAGNYQVAYFPSIGCPDSVAVDTVLITPEDTLGLMFTDFPGITSKLICDTTTILRFTRTGTASSPIITDSLEVAGSGAISGPGYFPGVFNGNDEMVVANLPVGGPYPVIRNVHYGGCVRRETLYVQVQATAIADFDYLDDLYCEGATNPVPHIVGTGGGVFTCSDPIIDAALDDVTGEIDISLFRLGTYVIQYSTQQVNPECFEVAFDTIQFLGINSAEFDYGGTRFCTSDAPFLIPILNDSLANDNWTVVSGLGLSIDTQTGIIDVLASATDTFTIQRQIIQNGGGANTCTSIFTREIIILQGDNTTTMNFVDSVFCQSGVNPRPVLFGDSTGQFLGVAGILFVPGTLGEINLAASRADTGFYTVIYRLESNNGCVVQLTDRIRIDSTRSTIFSYPKDFICSTSPTMSLSQLPSPFVGTFSMISSNGNPVNYVDPLTGDLDITGATIPFGRDQYEITFNPANTSCTEIVSKIITAYRGPDNANVFIYPDTVFCDLQTVSINSSGASYYWMFINGGPVTNQSWGGQGNNFFQSLDWQDGDRVHVRCYQPSVGFLRVPGDTALYVNPQGSYDIDTSNTCHVSFYFTLTEKPQPNLSLVNDIGVVSAGQDLGILLNTDVDGTAFVWQAVDINNATFLPREAGASPYFNTGTPYPLEASIMPTIAASPATAEYILTPSANGCFGPEMRIEVNVNPEDIAVFIPEVFTPGGDGFNDTWYVQLRQDVLPTDFSIKVFNRSGAEVLDMPVINSLWDGGDLPDGVYWWVLTDNRTRQKVDRGGLTIRRK